MGQMGYGYGSECHLLRWMGRHRRAFDRAVCDALKKKDGPVDWLDQPFAPASPWPDRELKGLEFISDPEVQGAWDAWWPQSGNSHNWDAVGWWGRPVDMSPVLVEAKANLPEIHSDCKAKSPASAAQIAANLQTTADALGVHDIAGWMKGNYQLGNRLAVVHFLRAQGYTPHLLLIYFVGDRQMPSRPAPATVEEWAQPLASQKAAMSLPANHALSPYVHELFLHVCELKAWRHPDAKTVIDLNP